MGNTIGWFDMHIRVCKRDAHGWNHTEQNQQEEWNPIQQQPVIDKLLTSLPKEFELTSCCMQQLEMLAASSSKGFAEAVWGGCCMQIAFVGAYRCMHVLGLEC
jgi:hypothetical protein